MGTRGPVPKRSDRRIRRNTDGGEVERLDVAGGPVEAPPLGFPTHVIAEEWYASLASSGQARYFEPSDWQAARVVAHEVGRMLNAGKASGQMLAAVWSAMNDLLTTEAARYAELGIDNQWHSAESRIGWCGLPWALDPHTGDVIRHPRYGKRAGER